MPTPTAYRDWAATVTRKGGVVTVMPRQAGMGNNVPAAKYSAAQIKALGLGPPAVWTAGNTFGYYAGGSAIAASQAAVEDEASGPKDPSWLDQILDHFGALGDKLRNLGTVAYYLIIVGAVVGLAIVLHNFSKKGATA